MNINLKNFYSTIDYNKIRIREKFSRFLKAGLKYPAEFNSICKY